MTAYLDPLILSTWSVHAFIDKDDLHTEQQPRPILGEEDGGPVILWIVIIGEGLIGQIVDVGPRPSRC